MTGTGSHVGVRFLNYTIARCVHRIEIVQPYNIGTIDLRYGVSGLKGWSGRSSSDKCFSLFIGPSVYYRIISGDPRAVDATIISGENASMVNERNGTVRTATASSRR